MISEASREEMSRYSFSELRPTRLREGLPESNELFWVLLYTGRIEKNYRGYPDGYPWDSAGWFVNVNDAPNWLKPANVNEVAPVTRRVCTIKANDFYWCLCQCNLLPNYVSDWEPLYYGQTGFEYPANVSAPNGETMFINVPYSYTNPNAPQKTIETPCSFAELKPRRLITGLPRVINPFWTWITEEGDYGWTSERVREMPSGNPWNRVGWYIPKSDIPELAVVSGGQFRNFYQTRGVFWCYTPEIDKWEPMCYKGSNFIDKLGRSRVPMWVVTVSEQMATGRSSLTTATLGFVRLDFRESELATMAVIHD